MPRIVYPVCARVASAIWSPAGPQSSPWLLASVISDTPAPWPLEMEPAMPNVSASICASEVVCSVTSRAELTREPSIVAWTVLAIGIAMGLYDPAFAALTWLYGREARSSITGITLIAGFASTLGWPLCAMFLHAWGWRAACLAWVGMNLLLAAPLNWLTIPCESTATAPPAVMEPRAPEPSRAAMPVLAFFFAATWFVQGAMAAHLPGLLRAAGASSTAAIAAAALVGPAQVGARIVEFFFLRSFHPLSSARLASVLHPIGAAFLVVLGAPGIVAFAVLHGAGNGMITIAKGTLPLALFGPRGYGLRSGTLSVPARVLQSTAPFLFGLLLDRVGIASIRLSAGLCLAAFGSLLILRSHPARDEPPLIHGS